MRDTLQYSDTVLIIPPLLVRGLEYFDGERTDLDLRAALTRITGELQMGTVVQSLIDAVSKAGFLEDENYERVREARHREFADSLVREPAHAGAAYPDDRAELEHSMARYLDGKETRVEDSELMGIAAPHVEPGRRVAILPGGLPDTDAGASRPNVRNSGNVALRRRRIDSA